MQKFYLIKGIINSLVDTTARWIGEEIVSLRLADLGISISKPFVIAGYKNISSNKDVFIQAFTTLWCGSDENNPSKIGYIEFGKRVYVGESCNLRAAGYSIRIGSDVLIANNVTIVSSNHGINRDHKIMDQEWNSPSGDIEIGDDVWIGAGAIILAGVKIGNGAVIGAGSVVTRDIDAFSIACGVPAKVVKSRI